MILFERYEYNPQTDLIGKGGFSRVYKAYDKKFNRQVALKVYKTTEFSERYSPMAEIKRVVELEHPNISRYMDIEELEKEDAFGQVEKVQICVMELLDGGNLENYYNRNKKIETFKKLLVDVLHGLSYLHRNGIIHRDIKPANILIKESAEGPIAKITDFGISKRSDSSTNSSSSALIVSIPYMAPEQLNAKKYGIEEKIQFNIDLWSLGVTVYEILKGEVLFKNSAGDSSEQIMTNIISNELPDKIRSLPAPFDDFVSRCVVKDAKQRVKSADELLAIFEPGLSEAESQAASADLLADSIKELTNGRQPGKKDKYKSKNLASEPAPITTPDHTVQISPAPLQRMEIMGSNSSPESDANGPAILSNHQAPFSHGNITGESADMEAVAENDTRIIAPQSAEQVNGNDTVLIPSVTSSENETRLIDTDPSGVQDDQNLTQETKLVEPETGAMLTNRAPMPENETGIIPESPISVSKDETRPALTENQIPTRKDLPNTEIVATIKSEKEHTKITLFNRYDYYPGADLIGKGGFSRVYKAFDQKLSRWVALKIYKTSEFSDRYSPIAEIRRVINLDHSNICRYLDIEEIEKVNPFGEVEKIQVCVMELLDCGNFSEYFNNSGRDLAVMKKLLQDVLHGISYLHKNGIIHRDIKPANILIKKTIEGPVAKITDFGISKLSDSVNNNSSSALIVSIPYMAPEQLNAKKYGINEKISSNLDLWSLGVTIYEVITGKVLFKNSEQDSSEQIMANIMAPELPDKINELSEPFKSIVTYCMIKNANDRAQKAEELLAMLNRKQPSDRFVVTIDPNSDDSSITKDASAARHALASDTKKPEINIPAIERSGSDTAKRKIRIAIESPEVEKKAKKHISALKIAIVAAAVLLAIAIIFYLGTGKKENKLVNGANQNDSGEPTKALQSPIEKSGVDTDAVALDKSAGDSLKNVSALPEPNKTLDNEKKVNSVTNKKVKASKKTEEGIETEISTPTNSTAKYILYFSVSEFCTIKKNGSNVGSVSPDQKFQLALEPGFSYLISATNEAGASFTRTIDVGSERAGKKGSFRVKF